MNKKIEVIKTHIHNHRATYIGVTAIVTFVAAQVCVVHAGGKGFASEDQIED